MALNDRGVSEFQALQEALSAARREALIYYVFDLLWLDGEDLRPLPLEERQGRLAELKLPADRGPARHSEYIVGDGATFSPKPRSWGWKVSSPSAAIGPTAARPQRRMAEDQMPGQCRVRHRWLYRSVRLAARLWRTCCWATTTSPADCTYAGRVGTGFSQKRYRIDGETIA